MGSDRAKRSRADQTGEHAGEPLLIRLSNRPVLLSLLRSPPLLSRGGETSKPREGDPRIRISRHDFSSPFEEDRASRGIGVDHPRTRFPFCPPPPLIGPPVCIKRQVGCALSADRPARPHESKVERNKLGRRVDIEGGKNSSRGARARARSIVHVQRSRPALPRIRGCCHASPFALPIRSGNRPRLPRTPAPLLFTIIVDRVSSPGALPSFLPFFPSFFAIGRVIASADRAKFPFCFFSASWNSSARAGREGERGREMARYSRILLLLLLHLRGRGRRLLSKHTLKI